MRLVAGVVLAVLVGSSLSACQAGAPQSSASPMVRVTGHVTAGPTCPVERNPPDPACAPRPVPGAQVTVLAPATGATVASATADGAGSYALDVPPGSYTLEAVSNPQGIGRPRQVSFVADADHPAIGVDIELDTGIR